MTYPYNDVRVDVIKVLSKLMAYNVGHVVWKLALSVPLSHQCIINLKKIHHVQVVPEYMSCQQGYFPCYFRFIAFLKNSSIFFYSCALVSNKYHNKQTCQISQ